MGMPTGKREAMRPRLGSVKNREGHQPNQGSAKKIRRPESREVTKMSYAGLGDHLFSRERRRLRDLENLEKEIFTTSSDGEQTKRALRSKTERCITSEKKTGSQQTAVVRGR